MNIGFVGMGKLGLPSALAIESKGHTVTGYDINPNVSEYIKTGKIPYMEEGVPELLAKTSIRMLPLADVLQLSDIVFVPVQTPHDPLYEGVTQLPETTADFNYTYLKDACRSISAELDKIGQDRIIVIISTVLPGTIEREIKPILSKHVKLCYNPFFIAMGTTVSDFLHPEIVLFGVDDKDAVTKAKKFYRTITNAPFHEMSIVNAELVKVNYNTYISMKINFANNLMEVCHRMRDQGADVDVVIDALSDCTRRIISPSYMRGGMPDGGGCHPRDNIALADFARRHSLSNDIYTEGMMVREHHIEWFANMMREHKDLPKVILGKSYKPGTNLTVGSPSIRLYNELISPQNGVPATPVTIWDPYADASGKVPAALSRPAVFFVGTRHEQFRTFDYPQGSVVIDPFGYVREGKGITLVRVGRQQRSNSEVTREI
ncbi:MAG: nucleotide sugar dehydrogenase [Candidatus Poribacteria bacterium]|nr:nucleotide sugar dehydrogenase [Candidatus Poribacteria bacterium]